MNTDKLLKLVELTPMHKQIAEKCGVAESVFSAMLLLEEMGHSAEELTELYLKSYTPSTAIAN